MLHDKYICYSKCQNVEIIILLFFIFIMLIIIIIIIIQLHIQEKFLFMIFTKHSVRFTLLYSKTLRSYDQ